jgi:hypothetical protein
MTQEVVRMRRAPLVCVLLAYIGCAHSSLTAKFRETYSAPDEVVLAEGSVVTLETGETLELNGILERESGRPAKVLIHKTHGVYLLVAEGFQNAYLLHPREDDLADVEIVKLEVDHAGAQGLTVQPGIASRCSSVSYRGSNLDRRLFVGGGGKTSTRACMDEERERGGGQR